MKFFFKSAWQRLSRKNKKSQIWKFQGQKPAESQLMKPLNATSTLVDGNEIN